MKTSMLVFLFAIVLTGSGCGSYVIEGTPGAAGTDGVNGTNGEDGKDGHNGTNGVDGKTSLVTLVEGLHNCAGNGTTLLTGLDLNDNSQLDPEEVSDSTDICDGIDGDSPEPVSLEPITLLNPCGDHPTLHDEVILVLPNGNLIASFSDKANGQNTRLSLLSPGRYVTTDGDNCVFNVDALGELSHESHHHG